MNGSSTVTYDLDAGMEWRFELEQGEAIAVRVSQYLRACLCRQGELEVTVATVQTGGSCVSPIRLGSPSDGQLTSTLMLDTLLFSPAQNATDIPLYNLNVVCIVLEAICCSKPCEACGLEFSDVAPFEREETRTRRADQLDDVRSSGRGIVAEKASGPERQRPESELP